MKVAFIVIGLLGLLAEPENMTGKSLQYLWVIFWLALAIITYFYEDKERY